MKSNKSRSGWAEFCRQQNISITGKRIFIDGLSGMAHGLFASLLIGCIINTIGLYVPGLKSLAVNPWAGFEWAANAGKLNDAAAVNLFTSSKVAAYAVQGAAMACAIAYSMQSPPFVIYSCLAVGYAANALGGGGGPLAVFFVTDKSIPLDSPILKQEERLAIIMGTEGDGLPLGTINRADYVVRIPMAYGVDSLNVAAASAVAFWELKKK